MLIHFHKDLVQKSLKAIREAQELSEVSKDIDEVLRQMEQVSAVNLTQEYDDNIKLLKLRQAMSLDKTMREKYPVIDNMLNIAYGLGPKQTSSGTSFYTNETKEYQALEQDYYGILCHVLLKKGFTETIEEFIEKVD